MIERRLKYRAGLHKLYLPYYDSLCQILSDDWQPVAGLRSFEEQDELYAHGRTRPGPVVTQARGGLSFHNYGLATDWDYFHDGQYSPLRLEDPLWKEYVDACEKVGVRCITWEKPHNEFPSRVGIRALYEAFQDDGISGVVELLNKEMEDGK